MIKYRVSPRGMLAAEALDASGSNSAQGFVAMWFTDDLKDVWTNGFDRGIRAAGYYPFRIDNKDYVGGITDEIMGGVALPIPTREGYDGSCGGDAA